MSSSNSAKCLFCTFTRPIRPRLRPPPPLRPFHTTPRKPSDDKPKPNNKPLSTKNASSSNPDEPSTDALKSYTASDLAALRAKYTPSQLAAIEAGEASIDPKDIVTQARFRTDNYALHYLDDLSIVDDVVDKPIRAPYENHDPNFRFKTDEELEEDLESFIVEKYNPEGDGSDYEEFMANLRLGVGKESAELNPRSFLAPELPRGILNEKFGTPEFEEEQKQKSSKAKSTYKPQAEEDEEPDELRLQQQTGMSKREISALRVKALVSHRVVNQTRLGKIQSQYVLTVAGNGNGLIGIGEGKSSEMVAAMQQARLKAIRNMQPILRYEKRTIFGDVEGKVGATELKLYNRPPGSSTTCMLPWAHI
jgi:small subunit ribosomal protein S5